MGFEEPTLVLVTGYGDKWVLIRGHQLFASAWNTIDTIISRSHIIYIVNPMPKESTLEIINIV